MQEAILSAKNIKTLFEYIVTVLFVFFFLKPEEHHQHSIAKSKGLKVYKERKYNIL